MTANEKFLDALIRHQIYLMRFSGQVRNSMLAMLNASEQELAAVIRTMGVFHGMQTAGDIKKLHTLIEELSEARNGAWTLASRYVTGQMNDLAKAEVGNMASIVMTVSPTVLSPTVPTLAGLRSIVKDDPFEGRTLSQWLTREQSNDRARIANAVRAGIMLNEDEGAILRRVIGTRNLMGRDAATQITRDGLDAIVRTAVAHVANRSRARFLAENSDLFSVEQFVATLDSATTPVCRANDKKKFKIGEGPQPPLHMRCRSLRVAALNADFIVGRPAKPVTERMLLREYGDKYGVAGVTTRDSLPRGHKSAFDAFARTRTRELVGQVPGSTSYQEWLSRQSVTFQNDVLGPTRGKLFRGGGLTLDRFVNRNGDELTLKELRSRHKDAFVAAGLEPSGF